jgi:hypothetical protein
MVSAMVDTGSVLDEPMGRKLLHSVAAGSIGSVNSTNSRVDLAHYHKLLNVEQSPRRTAAEVALFLGYALGSKNWHNVRFDFGSKFYHAMAFFWRKNIGYGGQSYQNVFKLDGEDGKKSCKPQILDPVSDKSWVSSR